MTTSEIIVLSLTAAGFLALGTFALLYGRKLRWPDGRRDTKRYAGRKVTVVWQEGVTRSSFFVEAAMYAVTGSILGWWMVLNNGNKDNDASHIGIHVISRQEMEKRWNRPGIAAYLTSISRKIGSGIPLIVVAERSLNSKGVESNHVDEVVRTGEPVIHEMMHYGEREFSKQEYDRDHDNPLIWKSSGGEASVQYRAQVLYRRLEGTG